MAHHGKGKRSMRIRSIVLALYVIAGATSVAVASAEGAGGSKLSPPPMAGCDEIHVGPLYDVTAEPIGGIQCFQFVTSETDRSKLSLLVAGLPPGRRKARQKHMVITRSIPRMRPVGRQSSRNNEATRTSHIWPRPTVRPIQSLGVQMRHER